ncbi:MAG: hypothetical protein SP1CHLAM54_14210 [Chlamydiia bacterium]|nr:hypothetical protein [Chlamydiia bacterium]MCH9616313.1 hypothetical protein [Chlamydiia bacterium]MCH9629701.1 hypothetical protein [Chlamydiia bacterium]
MAFIVAALALTSSPDLPDVLIESSGNKVPKAELYYAPSELTSPERYVSTETLLEDLIFETVHVHPENISSEITAFEMLYPRIPDSVTKTTFEIEDKEVSQLEKTTTPLQANPKTQLAKIRSHLHCPNKTVSITEYEQITPLLTHTPEAECARVTSFTPPTDIAVEIKKGPTLPSFEVEDMVVQAPSTNITINNPKQHLSAVVHAPLLKYGMLDSTTIFATEPEALTPLDEKQLALAPSSTPVQSSVLIPQTVIGETTFNLGKEDVCVQAKAYLPEIYSAKAKYAKELNISNYPTQAPLMQDEPNLVTISHPEVTPTHFSFQKARGTLPEVEIKQSLPLTLKHSEVLVDNVETKARPVEKSSKLLTKSAPKEIPTINLPSTNYENLPTLNTERKIAKERPTAHEIATYVHEVRVNASDSKADALILNAANINQPHYKAYTGYTKGVIKSDIPDHITTKNLLAKTWIDSPKLQEAATPHIQESELQATAIYTRDTLVTPTASTVTAFEIKDSKVKTHSLEHFDLAKAPLQYQASLEQKSLNLIFPVDFEKDFATFKELAFNTEAPKTHSVESSLDVIHKIPHGNTEYDFYYDEDAPPEALYLNSVVYMHPDEEGKELVAAASPFSFTFPEVVRYPHVLHTSALAVRDIVDPLVQSDVSITYSPRILCNETPEIITVSTLERPENPALVELFSHQFPSIPRNQADSLSRANRSTRYNLSRQPTSNALNNVPSSDEFEIDVSIVKRKDRHKGYVFSISVYPNQELNLQPVQQHYAFIIDKTATVKKYRYDMFRKAILKALNYLQEGDTFNIYVVDKKIHRLSDTPLLWRKKHVTEARQFLYSNNFTHFFNSNIDLYDVLPEISNELPNDQGENTIVLLTDGSSLANIQSKKYTLANLFENNKGRYTLHTACIDRRSRGAMLDLVSTFSNGEFVYSQTNTAFPRKLARLVKHTSQLLSKDMHVTLTNAEGTNVEIYPHATMVPHMYADRPFTVYGTIDEPRDLDLVIQGRFNDRYLYIKKKANLTTARQSTRGLNKILAIQQAYVCYEHYLNTHDTFYLQQAEERLRDYKLKPATTRR